MGLQKKMAGAKVTENCTPFGISAKLLNRVYVLFGYSQLGPDIKILLSFILSIIQFLAAIFCQLVFHASNLLGQKMA